MLHRTLVVAILLSTVTAIPLRHPHTAAISLTIRQHSNHTDTPLPSKQPKSPAAHEKPVLSGHPKDVPRPERDKQGRTKQTDKDDSDIPDEPISPRNNTNAKDDQQGNKLLLKNLKPSSITISHNKNNTNIVTVDNHDGALMNDTIDASTQLSGDLTPEKTRAMSTSEMLAEARSQSRRFMKGGFVEFAEWLFVFILVAPGTFPAIGCVLLSCGSFWRRRLGEVSEPPAQGSEREHTTWTSPVGYQHVSISDGALVARTRVKGTDDRDNDVL